MKTIMLKAIFVFTFLATGFCITVNNAPSQNHYWNYMQVSPVHSIRDIFFLDSLVGWYVTAGMDPDIGRTSNGGANWSIISLGSQIWGLSSVYFLNENTGWVVGSFSVIRKTTNGGVTWINQDGIGPSEYTTVHFSDENTGFFGVAGSLRGALYRTTNGGTNWYLATQSPEDTSDIYSQYWLNHDTGWIVGGNTLLKTMDCGLTYQDFYIYFPPSTNGGNGFIDVYFVNEYTGWLSGITPEQKNLWKTMNGGYNWVYQENPIPIIGYSRQINGIKFINENTGWGASSALMIIRTTNGGANWYIDLQSNMYDEYFFGLDRNFKGRVWAGSTEGRLWYRDSVFSTAVINNNTELPAGVKLYHNYPNPFNPTTNVKFTLGRAEKTGKLDFIKLIVFDITGRVVSVLVNKALAPGTYEMKFDGTKLANGVYFYALYKNGDLKDTKKMVLLK
ncbi:MAG: YCF48-related protein [Ignavibacteria bacterium]|nr:YCF48-related protein [Ignavibacteria bacterium]